MKRRWWLAGALSLCVWLLIQAPVAAANKPIGLEVTPLRAYPSQAPGTTTTGSLTLTNRTTANQDVAMSAEVFRTINENYDYGFDSSGKEDATWVRFSDTNVELAPNQSKEVNYDLAVPANASPGGHYLSLIATVAPTENNGVTEVSRVASLVYLEVSGKLVKSGALLPSNLPWFVTTPKLSVDTRVSNSGNTHFQARIGVSAKPLIGAKQQLTIFSNYILPATVRRITGDIQLPQTPGIYRVSLDFAPPQGGETVQSYWVVYTPVWFLVGLAVGILILALWLWRLIYTHHHHRRHKRTGLGPDINAAK